MLNYIKSEFYRTLRNKQIYILVAGLIAFLAAANLALGIFASEANFPYSTTKFSLSSLYSSMTVPMFITLAMASILFGQEYKTGTLKNAVSFGIARKTLFLGKFIVSWLVSLVSFLLISLSHIVFAYLLLENSGMVYLREMLFALLACLPIFTLSLMFAHTLAFLFENDWLISGVWLLVMVVMPQTLALIGKRVPLVKVISSWQPHTIIKNANYDPVANKIILNWGNPDILLKCFLVGIVGAILCYVVGSQLFEKKEIS